MNRTDWLAVTAGVLGLLVIVGAEAFRRIDRDLMTSFANLTHTPTDGETP